MATDPNKTGHDASDPLKVFISYSRADVAFADELELALADKGFEVLIDRHAITPGEPREPRLGQLILSCDTVVFILTDTSAASPVCAWEVAEAERLGKRMLVTTLGPVSPDVAPPPALKSINWIACWQNPDVPGSSLIRGVLELDKTLRTDLGWLRERTVHQEQARRWMARAETTSRADYDAAASSMLLRGNVLEEALAWAARAPDDETVPTEVGRFLHASQEAEARLKAEADANLKEREEALKRAEEAAAKQRRAERGLRVWGGGAGGWPALVSGGALWRLCRGAPDRQAGPQSRHPNRARGGFRLSPPLGSRGGAAAPRSQGAVTQRPERQIQWT